MFNLSSNTSANITVISNYDLPIQIEDELNYIYKDILVSQYINKNYMKMYILKIEIPGRSCFIIFTVYFLSNRIKKTNN